MKTVLYTGLAAGALAVGAFVWSPSDTVSAQAQVQAQEKGRGYGYTRMLETKADILGMTTDELSAALEEKTFLEVAADQNVAKEDWQAAMKEQAAARWQERGLSEAEVQERTQAMEERHADCDGDGDGEPRGPLGGGERYGRN